jgi:hypothetical protein
MSDERYEHGLKMLQQIDGEAGQKVVRPVPMAATTAGFPLG